VLGPTRLTPPDSLLERIGRTFTACYQRKPQFGRRPPRKPLSEATVVAATMTK
jgi:hypothetical protein